MDYIARVGGELEVRRNSVALGSPPSESAAVLLLALLAEDPDWCDRAWLATQMYPTTSTESADAAFRVTLHRLRSWLGKDAVDSHHGKVRLAQAWTIDRKLASGELATGLRIVPGLHHPLVEGVRARWSGPTEASQTDTATKFIQAVTAGAQQDRDLGRSLLVAGAPITESMRPEDVRYLMDLTRPQRNSDPHSAEFLEVAAVLQLREGAVPSAIALLLRAYRLAIRAGGHSTAMRVGHRIAFLHTEVGDFDEAATWLNRVKSQRKGKEFIVETTNAEAALAWNANELQMAMSVLATGMKNIDKCPRAERLHYLSNYAVMATEFGDLNLAQELLSRGMEEALHDGDRIFWLACGLVKGSHMLAAGSGSEAVQHFTQLKTQIEQDIDQLGICYAVEWLGEALAKTGNPDRSARYFHSLRENRKQLGCRTNPRIVARFEKLLA